MRSLVATATTETTVAIRAKRLGLRSAKGPNSGLGSLGLSTCPSGHPTAMPARRPLSAVLKHHAERSSSPTTAAMVVAASERVRRGQTGEAVTFPLAAVSYGRERAAVTNVEEAAHGTRPDISKPI